MLKARMEALRLPSIGVSGLDAALTCGDDLLSMVCIKNVGVLLDIVSNDRRRRITDLQIVFQLLALLALARIA
jgi:hypothetical protein